jgi:hypothetical protein
VVVGRRWWMGETAVTLCVGGSMERLDLHNQDFAYVAYEIIQSMSPITINILQLFNQVLMSPSCCQLHKNLDFHEFL